MTTYKLQDTPEDYVPRDERKEYPVLPENRKFLAEVLEVVEKDAPWYVEKGKPESGYARQVSFKFKVLADEGMDDDELAEWPDTWVWGSTGTEFFDHPDCKFRQWVMAIIGVDELPSGFELDLDSDFLAGQTVALTLKHREGKDKRTGGVKTYVNVLDLIPAMDVDTGGTDVGVF